MAEPKFQDVPLPNGGTLQVPLDWTPGMIQAFVHDMNRANRVQAAGPRPYEPEAPPTPEEQAQFPQPQVTAQIPPAGPMAQGPPVQQTFGSMREFENWRQFRAPEPSDTEAFAAADAARIRNQAEPLLSVLRPAMERIIHERGIRLVTADDMRKVQQPPYALAPVPGLPEPLGVTPGQSEAEYEALAIGLNQRTMERVRNEAIAQIRQGLWGEAARGALQAGKAIGQMFTDPVNWGLIAAAKVGGPWVALPMAGYFLGAQANQAEISSELWMKGHGPLSDAVRDLGVLTFMSAFGLSGRVRGETVKGFQRIGSDIQRSSEALDRWRGVRTIPVTPGAEGAPPTIIPIPGEAMGNIPLPHVTTSTTPVPLPAGGGAAPITPTPVPAPAVGLPALGAAPKPAPVKPPRPTPLENLGTALEYIDRQARDIGEAGEVTRLDYLEKALNNLQDRLRQAQKAAPATSADLLSQITKAIGEVRNMTGGGRAARGTFEAPEIVRALQAVADLGRQYHAAVAPILEPPPKPGEAAPAPAPAPAAPAAPAAPTTPAPTPAAPAPTGPTPPPLPAISDLLAQGLTPEQAAAALGTRAEYVQPSMSRIPSGTAPPAVAPGAAPPTTTAALVQRMVANPTALLDLLAEHAGGESIDLGRVTALGTRYTAEGLATALGLPDVSGAQLLAEGGLLRRAEGGAYELNPDVYGTHVADLQRRGFLPTPGAPPPPIRRVRTQVPGQRAPRLADVAPTGPPVSTTPIDYVASQLGTPALAQVKGTPFEGTLVDVDPATMTLENLRRRTRYDLQDLATMENVVVPYEASRTATGHAGPLLAHYRRLNGLRTAVANFDSLNQTQLRRLYSDLNLPNRPTGAALLNMTRDQFRRDLDLRLQIMEEARAIGIGLMKHRLLVEQALEAKQLVPVEVLRQYPDLAKRYNQKLPEPQPYRPTPAEREYQGIIPRAQYEERLRVLAAREGGRITALLPSETEHLLNYTRNQAASGDPIALRDHAMLQLMASTGMRNTEVRLLQTPSIHWPTATDPRAWITVESETAKFGRRIREGGPDKTRYVPIDAAAQDALRQYLNVGRPLLTQPGVKEPALVFLSDRGGNALNQESISKFVPAIGEKAGLSRHLTPHMLRHTFITRALENNVSLSTLMQWVGHIEERTTQRYTHFQRPPDHAFEEYNKVPPAAPPPPSGASPAPPGGGPPGFFPRRSEAQGLGEPALPPTVEDVRRQREAQQGGPAPQGVPLPPEESRLPERGGEPRTTYPPNADEAMFTAEEIRAQWRDWVRAAQPDMAWLRDLRAMPEDKFRELQAAFPREARLTAIDKWRGAAIDQEALVRTPFGTAPGPYPTGALADPLPDARHMLTYRDIVRDTVTMSALPMNSLVQLYRWLRQGTPNPSELFLRVATPDYVDALIRSAEEQIVAKRGFAAIGVGARRADPSGSPWTGAGPGAPSILPPGEREARQAAGTFGQRQTYGSDLGPQPELSMAVDRGPLRGDPPDIAAQASATRSAVGDPLTGLPTGINPGPKDAAAQLMSAAHRLRQFVRSSVKLQARQEGLFKRERETDNLYMANIRNQRVMSHEMGHGMIFRLFGTTAGELATIREAIEHPNKRFLVEYIRKHVPPGQPMPTADALMAELKPVSELMRGPIGGVAYRLRPNELVGDYFSLFAHDPARARAMAPAWSRYFEAALAKDPWAQETVDMIHRWDVRPEPGWPPAGETEDYSGLISEPREMPGKIAPSAKPTAPEHVPSLAAAALEAVKQKYFRKLVAEEQRARIVGENWRSRLPLKLLSEERLKGAVRHDENALNDVGAYIEGTGRIDKQGDTIQGVRARMTPEKERLVRDVRYKFEEMHQELNKFVKPAMGREWIAFIRDYMPHFYVRDAAYEQTLNRFLTESPNAKLRTIPTLAQAVEFGFRPITQNPATLYQIYSRINWQVAANKALVHEIGKLRTPDGEPVIQPAKTADPSWPRMDRNPLFEKQWAFRTAGGQTLLWKSDVAVHPDVWRVLQQVMDQPLSGKWGARWDALMSYSRAVSFAGSLFHDVNLAMASTATGLMGAKGFTRLNPLRGLFRVMERDPVTGERKFIQPASHAGESLRQSEEHVTHWAERGLRFNWSDSQMFEHSSRNAIDAMVQKVANVPVLKDLPSVRNWMRAAVEFRQKNLWALTHDTAKLLAANDIAAKIIPNLKPGISVRMAEEKIASMLNDAYGGQEWQTKLWMDPQMRKIYGRLLLAPDWTISTIRSVPLVSDAATFVRTHLPGRLKALPGEYEGALGNKLRGQFWAYELGTVFAATAALQYAITQRWGDPAKGDHLWIGDNEVGKGYLNDARGTVDVTPMTRWFEEHGWVQKLQDTPVIRDAMPQARYYEPERHYVNLGKRATETFRWVLNPVASLTSKMARPLSEALKQLSSREGDFAAEWAREEAGPELPLRIKSIAKALLVPFSFSGNQFMLSEPMRKGMTRYKAQEAYEAIFTMQADPNAFTRWWSSIQMGRPKLPYITWGNSANFAPTREDIERLKAQVYEAASRNAVRPEEALQKAYSKIKGIHESARSTALWKQQEALAHNDKVRAAEQQEIIDREDERLNRLGVTQAGLIESMKARREQYMPPPPANINQPAPQAP